MTEKSKEHLRDNIADIATSITTMLLQLSDDVDERSAILANITLLTGQNIGACVHCLCTDVNAGASKILREVIETQPITDEERTDLEGYLLELAPSATNSRH